MKFGAEICQIRPRVEPSATGITNSVTHFMDVDCYIFFYQYNQILRAICTITKQGSIQFLLLFISDDILLKNYRLTTISDYDIVISRNDITTYDKGEIVMQDNIVLTEATYYILLALYSPRHGYGIMQEVEEMSNGRVRLAAGTLYGVLSSMVDKGWIKQLPIDSGSRKKNYQITDLGLQVLKNEVERLRELFTNGDKVLGGK